MNDVQFIPQSRQLNIQERVCVVHLALQVDVVSAEGKRATDSSYCQYLRSGLPVPFYLFFSARSWPSNPAVWRRWWWCYPSGCAERRRHPFRAEPLAPEPQIQTSYPAFSQLSKCFSHLISKEDSGCTPIRLIVSIHTFQIQTEKLTLGRDDEPVWALLESVLEWAVCLRETDLFGFLHIGWKGSPCPGGRDRKILSGHAA